MAAVAAPWNKSLPPRPRFGCAHSGADEGCVRAESTGVGSLAMAGFLPVLSCSNVGVSSSVARPGMRQALTVRCRRLAAGFLDVWWTGLGIFLDGFHRRAQVCGQRNTGCVPGRCIFSVSSFCGSFVSLCAMVFLMTLASVLLSSFFVATWLRKKNDSGRWLLDAQRFP
ncbi:hypothetical protein U9M48_009271 [Paspalum notatum var. saurae]|uniref:Uncharacterized protein n=1 Tax=Paspalum notatum var. saurae TaxID=547442 RepID=A0AAQ3SQT8_PASNO